MIFIILTGGEVLKLYLKIFHVILSGTLIVAGCSNQSSAYLQEQEIKETMNQTIDKEDEEINKQSSKEVSDEILEKTDEIKENIEAKLENDIKNIPQVSDFKKLTEAKENAISSAALAKSKTEHQLSLQKEKVNAPQVFSKDTQSASKATPPAAKKIAEQTKSEETKPEEKKAETEKEISKEASIYKDGLYEGSAMGREGNIEVVVEITSGRIQKVQVISHKDTPSLAQNVFRLMTKEILSVQSAEVSMISGATVTSKAFKEAVKNALEGAKAY